jgi:hypothetical protein
MEVRTGKDKILLEGIENISKKLDELLSLKKDIILLTKKTENIEKMLIEELTEEEKVSLSEAMREHSKGRTISLAEAEKACGL